MPFTPIMELADIATHKDSEVITVQLVRVTGRGEDSLRLDARIAFYSNREDRWISTGKGFSVTNIEDANALIDALTTGRDELERLLAAAAAKAAAAKPASKVQSGRQRRVTSTKSATA